MEGIEEVNCEKASYIGTCHPQHRNVTRNHISNSSSASLTSLPASNPRDSPDFFTCDSCGVFDDEVRALDSQWRVVLVCKGCHDRIRSAAICSYCFNNRDADVLVCRSCLCRVHLRCVNVQRGYVTLSDYDPVSFTCIDCCAIPRRQFRDLRRSRALMEDFVRSVSSAAKKKVTLAARARWKALKKADDARVAMELAFDAIMFARDAAAADEQLAMQLHCSMNGSTRVLRRMHQTNLDKFVPIKKDYGNGVVSSMCRKSGNWRGRVDEKLGVCKKDNGLFESNQTSLSERTSYKKPGISVKREFCETDVHYASDSTKVISAKKGRHFEALSNCDEVINNDGLELISCRESADSNSLMEI